MILRATRRVAPIRDRPLLGDRVERAVAPIAHVLRIRHCGGCERRKRLLNRLDRWARRLWRSAVGKV